MFNVRITPEAKIFIVEQFSREGLTHPGLMIHRQGPVGEVERSSHGRAKWTVERPHPSKAQVFEISDHNDDLVLVDDLSVWLALIPKTGEAGVRVTLRHGELFVEALDA